MTLLGLGQLVTREAPRQGRKIIIWVAPAGLLIFGQMNIRDAKTEQKAFAGIVDISTQLREAQITLYSVDPRGVEDSGEGTFSWQDYLKEVNSRARLEWTIWP